MKSRLITAPPPPADPITNNIALPPQTVTKSPPSLHLPPVFEHSWDTPTPDPLSETSFNVLPLDPIHTPTPHSTSPTIPPSVIERLAPSNTTPPELPISAVTTCSSRSF